MCWPCFTSSVRSPQNRDQQLLTLQKKEVGHDCFFPRRFHSPGLHHEDHRRGPGSGKGGSIVLGALITFGVFLQRLIKEGGLEELVHQFRRDLAMAILLGLEFLIAADIVGTLAVSLSFQDLGLLGLLIVIRTFLSFTLQLETNGRWPWQEQI